MPSRNSKRRVNAKGRNDYGGRFVRLPHKLLQSNAYRALTTQSRALLTELVMLHDGNNNGSLYLSVRDAGDRIGLADLTAVKKAFDQLIELGFIEMTKEGHFSVKAGETSRARCWRLTWEVGPGRKAPNPLYLTREPAPKTSARKRMERGMRALKRYRKAGDSNRLPVLDSDIFSPFEDSSGSGFQDTQS